MEIGTGDPLVALVVDYNGPVSKEGRLSRCCAGVDIEEADA